MFQDLRFALRQLRRYPGFALLAILTLALGTGGTTIFFGQLRALVLDPLPQPQADRLVQLWSGQGWPLSVPDFLDIRDSATSFEALGAYSPRRANLGGDRPQSVAAALCTADVLRAFGTAPLIGRLIEPADEQPGAAPVALISHSLWLSAFAGDPAIVGRSVPLNGGSVTVVGVMPAGFEFSAPWMRGTDCQLWSPLSLDRLHSYRGNHWMCAVGRLKPGVTVGAAAAEFRGIGARLTATYPDTNTGKTYLLRSLKEEMTQDMTSITWLLFGACFLVLLIACSNVASMLLARGALRQNELGLRTAVGASRARIFRLVLCESILLAVAGTMVGALFAYAAAGPLGAFLPVGECRRAAANPDAHALLFAAGLALLSALVAGLPTAWTATRASVADALRAGSRSSTGAHARHRLLRLLVVGQIVVAFMLVNGAALFATSYLKVRSANRNLDTAEVLAVELSPSGPRYETGEQRIRFARRLVDEVGALPGVEVAATTSKLPLEGGNNGNILVDDQIYDVAADRPITEFSSLTGDYFGAAGIRFLRGRPLTDGDVVDGHLGVVVNRAFAEEFWPGRDPLGHTIRDNSPQSSWTATVVGVVENVRQFGATGDPRPEIYWGPDRAGRDNLFLIVRTALAGLAIEPALRHAVAQLDPDLPIARIRTLAGIVHDATYSQRLITLLVGAFMALALLLVGIGLFGTLSYLIEQRTREIGIRLALGAAPRSIARLVVGQGLRWLLLGSVCGAVGAYASATLLRSLLWQVAPFSPLPVSVGLVLVVVVGLLACWLPTRRAARVDPIVALRAD